MKPTLLFTGIFMLVVSVVHAQSIGDQDSTKKIFTFNTLLQDVNLDPSPTVGDDTRSKVIQEYNSINQKSNFDNSIGLKILADILDDQTGISVPGWVIDFATGTGDFSFVTVDPTFGVGGSIKYGGYFELNSVGNADIEVDYPIEIIITFPDSNTFGCGDLFEILTEYRINEKNDMLKVDPPFYEMEIGPVLEDLKFEAGIGLKLKVCFGLPVLGECVGGTASFNEGFTYSKSIPLPSFLDPLPPMVIACESAFGNNTDFADLISCSTPSQLTPFLNLGQDLLDGYNASYNTNYNMGTLSPTKATLATPDLPSASGITLPEVYGQFLNVTENDLNFQSLNGGKTLNVSGSISDISKLQFDLISLLDYAKIPTGYSLGGGIASFDIGDLSPTFNVDQSMDFSFTPEIHISVDLGTAMAWEVHDEIDGIVSSGNSRFVDLLAGQKIVGTYPEAKSNPTLVQSVSSMDGDFTTITEQKYFTSYDVNFLEIAVGSFEETLYSTTINKSETDESPITVQDHTFNLTGIDEVSLPDFFLNPENPIINVDYVGVEDIVNIGGGERVVVYKITFSNGGDVTLNDLELNFDLASTFDDASSMEVLCIASDELGTNNNYDGNSDINLLGSNNSLNVLSNATVEIVVQVKPEIASISSTGCFEPVIYDASTQAFGVSPIGTEVQSNIYHCTNDRTADDIVASVDLGAAVIDGAEDFTIYGWTWVKFDKPFSRSQGNVGSSDDIIFENVSYQNGNEVEIVGDIHAGDRVFVQGESKVIVDYIQVANEVYIPNYKSYIAETGAISDYSSCVTTLDNPNWSVPKFSGKTKLNIPDGDTVVLTPGNYGEIKMNEASVVEFSAGTYNIAKWVFKDDDAQALFNTSNGDVILNLGVWQPQSRSGLQLRLNNGGTVDQIHYNYYGNQLCKFDNSFVQGIIIAPNTEVEFDNYSHFEGSCYADKVNFKNYSSFASTKSLEPLNVNSACSDVLEEGNSEIFDDRNDDLTTMNQSNKVQSANTKTSAQKTEETSKETEVELWDLGVYPNPFKSTINVSCEKAISSVTVLNYLGQPVLYLTPNVQETTLDLSGNSAGLYTIIIEISETQRIFKVVKM